MARTAPLHTRTASSGGAPEWRISREPVPYPEAVAAMEARVAEIAAEKAPELVWLLEHPPLYTAGTSAKAEDLLKPDLLPVFETGRGGQYTYHGPGQRLAYVMLDIRGRGLAATSFVHALESWAIEALARFGVTGERRSGRVGIWVDRSQTQGAGHEDKIAAIGVRVRRGVTYHGLSINVAPDLSHYQGIVPCGIPGSSGLGVTSLQDLGISATTADVDAALRAAFDKAFSAEARAG